MKKELTQLKQNNFSKMNIIEDKNNDLLGRREVKIIIEAEKTPSFSEATKIVAEQFKSNEENIAVKKIKGRFGKNTFLISANIYKSKEGKDKIEPQKELKKEGQSVEKKEEKQQTEQFEKKENKEES